MLPAEERRQIQLTELEILTEFDRLCKLGNLRYYIIAGTLLGAVRHKGFIPWDEDIDVAMPRRDYEKFHEICQQELSDGFFYQSVITDPGYPFLFNRLRKEDTFVDEPAFRNLSMHKGIYIDIFPLDGCPATDRGGILFFKWVQQIHCAVMAQADPDFVCGYRKKYMRALHTLLRSLPSKGLLTIWNLTWRTAQNCFKKKICTVCGRHGYPGESYLADWYRETVLLEFENRMLPAPAGWDAMLTNLYGDYMSPPPESERQGHFE